MCFFFSLTVTGCDPCGNKCTIQAFWLSIISIHAKSLPATCLLGLWIDGPSAHFLEHNPALPQL